MPRRKGKRQVVVGGKSVDRNDKNLSAAEDEATKRAESQAKESKASSKSAKPTGE